MIEFERSVAVLSVDNPPVSVITPERSEPSPDRLEVSGRAMVGEL